MHKESRYYSLEVTTTQKCDMACTYCFEGEELQNNKKQEIDISKAINDLLSSDKFNDIYDGITLDFWGGEPTLNSKLIFELIEEFKNKPVDFFFYTNGFNAISLMNILYKFKEIGIGLNRFSFQISYDGISHDKERVDHQGNGTQQKVLATIKHVYKLFPDVSFSIKSTLPIDELPRIIEHYDHYEELQKEIDWITWQPTLEYTNKYLIEQEFLDKLTKDFKILAKREIEFFKKNNRFLWNWFGTGERAMCSAGMNISNIDLDGNLLVCHGALYSDKKEEFIIGNVKNISDAVIASHERHKELFDMPEQCKDCSATVCYQCPIINVDNSDKSYDDAYHADPKSDLCSIYKSFGLIDRTVQKYLGKKKDKNGN